MGLIERVLFCSCVRGLSSGNGVGAKSPVTGSVCVKPFDESVLDPGVGACPNACELEMVSVKAIKT